MTPDTAEPTRFRKEFAPTAFRDIAELDDLARAVSVCITKSENMADTARLKIATVSQALDAGDFGDWNTQQWLMLRVGLGIEQVPLYLPKPREIAAAAVEAEPHLSDRALAKKTGVGLGTVQRARAATDPNGSVQPRIGLDGKERRVPAPKPAGAAAGKIACIGFRREFERFTLRLQSKPYIDPLSRAERVTAVTRFASLLGVEIQIVEADESVEPTTPTACSEPTAQETPPAPTPASEPKSATAVPPGEAPAASPEPTQPTSNRARCPRDQKTGQCRYSECNKTGVCGISKEPIASEVLA